MYEEKNWFSYTYGRHLHFIVFIWAHPTPHLALFDQSLLVYCKEIVIIKLSTMRRARSKKMEFNVCDTVTKRDRDSPKIITKMRSQLPSQYCWVTEELCETAIFCNQPVSLLW